MKRSWASGRQQREYRALAAELMRAVLGESRRHAATLARRHLDFRQQALAHWRRFAEAPDRDLRRLLKAIRFDEEAAFRALARHESRPFVFVSIHMGNYLGGYHRIAACLPRERRICVLRRLHGSELESRAFARYEALGLRLAVLRQAKRPAREALSALRRGDHLVTFCDLPARFGPVTAVRFLGHLAALVRGPAELAAAAGALVVPLVNHVDAAGIHRLEVCSPMETGRAPATSRPGEVGVLAQSMARLAGGWIRRQPAQWTNWPLVPEMLASPSPADAVAGAESATVPR